MKLLRYLRHSVGTVVVIAVLLMVQAACDLALPNFTSQIVDVGIQQSGIEDCVPEELSSTTHDAIAALLTADGDGEEGAADLFAASYEKTGEGTWRITDEGLKSRDDLGKAVSLPLVLVHMADGSLGFAGVSGSGAAGADGSNTASSGDSAVGSAFSSLAANPAAASPEALASVMDAARAYAAATGDSLVDQQAIAAVRAEYESLGFDMGAMQLSYLLRIGAFMLGVAAIGMAAAVFVGFFAARTGAKIGRDLRRRLFARVVSFSDAEIGRFSAASLITRGTNDIQLIQGVTVMMLRMVIYAPILAIGGIIMVARTNLAMSWVILIAVVAILALVGILMGAAMPKFRMMQRLIDRVNLVSREILTGMPVIRAFNRERHEEARFDAASSDLMRTQLFTNRVMTFMLPSMMLIMNGTSALIVWVGASYIDTGAIQTGDLIAFITYSMVIVMSFFMISMVSIMLPRADVAATRVNEVLSCEPSIVDPLSPSDDELSDAPGARIEFRHVSFGYDDSETPAVEDVSFVAEPGRTTAIIGSTGSGKSTLLKLLMRFYDVTAGSILVDGVDVRELSQHKLRLQFGYVPQQAFLFSGTIASNVAYSNDSMSDARIDRALSIAQATEFVEGKEEGKDASISQGGTNVSGGQRQRLAIARAVATDARAYLFDDSFSALDYRTDAALRHALATKLSGKTVLIVAQRIATISSADLIIVLDEGRVVGSGTHRELLATCEEYREIALSQLSEAELSKGGDAA